MFKKNRKIRLVKELNLHKCYIKLNIQKYKRKWSEFISIGTIGVWMLIINLNLKKNVLKMMSPLWEKLLFKIFLMSLKMANPIIKKNRISCSLRTYSMLQYILHIRIILSMRILSPILLILFRKAHNRDKIGLLNQIQKLKMNLPNQFSKVHILRMPALTSAKKLSRW